MHRNISIRSAIPSDLITLTTLDLLANCSHPLIAHSFPYPFLASKLFLAHLRYCFSHPQIYKFRVAVLAPSSPPSPGSDSGVDVFAEEERRALIVGFLLWREAEEAGSREEEAWDWEKQLPPGTDKRLWRKYVEVMGTQPATDVSSRSSIGKSSMLENFRLSDPYHRVLSLDTGIEKFAVTPAYQRQGIGTLLLQSFLDEIDERDTAYRICMRSSVKGKALYERFQWAVEKEYRMDLRDWGRRQAYVDFDMSREIVFRTGAQSL
ncbi:hypothetical protein BUE80_DR006970 [Diplocarpon rosae]|nr:hypothetical protein BUE80_DR006970 [Diplocarpon rosae]